MAAASGPLIRTTPIPPRPRGVAMATMVSLVSNPNHFAVMKTDFMNASPELSDVHAGSSATVMCTMRRW